MKSIKLQTAAWYGDKPLMLEFPDHWDVSVIGDQSIPALSMEEIRNLIRHPVIGEPLSAVVKGKNRVAIIIDDLSRPTPTKDVVGLLLDELQLAGFSPEQILIIIATGTHSPVTPDELAQKAGGNLPPGVRLISHDCHQGLKNLGKTKAGTPVFINREVYNCDLRIGVGCLYPHPSAGYSGGAKALVPGLAGFETIRYLHDHLRGAEKRAGSVDNEFRLECEHIAAQIGLHFIVNVALNQQRQISDVFAGDMINAFRMGVQASRRIYRVSPQPDADVVIADMYPFDIDLTFAYDRGLWPLDYAGGSATRVVLAACPRGVGDHELFPLQHSFSARLIRRLKHFRMRDLRSLAYRLKVAKRLVKGRPQEVFFVSPGLQNAELKTVFPYGRLFAEWAGALQEIERTHPNARMKAAVYQAAPLMIPEPAINLPYKAAL